MVPLLDGDVLTYEVGFGAEASWEGESPPPFEIARELLESRVANICALAGGTGPPEIFITGKDNFREKLATIRPYKGTRSGRKPFHYTNIRAYLTGVMYATCVDGIEADDALALRQIELNKQGIESVICSRDKDLRQVPGWTYSWELGDNPSFGPEFVEGYGWIKISESGKKIIGVGDKFFFSQCLTGDVVDNIQGIPRYGPKKAFETLVNTNTYEEGLQAIVEAYRGFYGEEYEKYLLENGQLLWMTRSLNEDGSPVLWRIDA